MSQLIDKNGKTEEQFLREYDVTKYFRPSVTVDAILSIPKKHGGRILLIKRGGHPFLGDYAFPGGFVEENEPCEIAARRELEEETGIVGVPLKQLVAVSTPGRDPRWRNITVAFYAEMKADMTAVGGDDASAAQWFDFTVKETGRAVTVTFTDGNERFDCVLDVSRDEFGEVDLNKTRIVERGCMAFDHAKVVYYLYDRLRSKA